MISHAEGHVYLLIEDRTVFLNVFAHKHCESLKGAAGGGGSWGGRWGLGGRAGLRALL